MSEEFMVISKIGADNFGKPVRLRGVIVSASKVKHICVEGCFLCKKCGLPLLMVQDGEELEEPNFCNNIRCKRASQFDFDSEKSKFDNYQELKIQELQRDMVAGRIPKNVEIRIIGEQTDLFKAGDEVTVVGEVRHKLARKGAIVFTPYVRATNVVRLNRIPEDMEITLEDEAKIQELSKNPFVYQILIESIAPHLRGIVDQKEAIIYALFGGVRTESRRSRKRGDINLLFIGDPSIGKSELLMSITRVAPRAIYTSGRGSSSAGLTAAVIKEKNGWVLQAGALVLGDRGVVAIDELDKMLPQDRDSIHIALEQGFVPINKAGINTVLDTRCTVIAVCNPTFVYYDDTRSVAENIKGKLDPALLTRFDLIFVIRDIPEVSKDDKVFKSILGMCGEEECEIEILDEEFMKKYISYARKLNPTITAEAKNLLDDFAQEMRRRSKQSEDVAVMFTYRTLQALMRLSEAHARIRLSMQVEEFDANSAIAIMKKSLTDVGLAENVQRSTALKTVSDKLTAVYNIICDLAVGKADGAEESLIIQAVLERQNIPAEETIRLLHVLENKDMKVYQPKSYHYKPLGVDVMLQG